MSVCLSVWETGRACSTSLQKDDQPHQRIESRAAALMRKRNPPRFVDYPVPKKIFVFRSHSILYVLSQLNVEPIDRGQSPLDRYRILQNQALEGTISPFLLVQTGQKIKGPRTTGKRTSHKGSPTLCRRRISSPIAEKIAALQLSSFDQD